MKNKVTKPEKVKYIEGKTKKKKLHITSKSNRKPTENPKTETRNKKNALFYIFHKTLHKVVPCPVYTNTPVILGDLKKRKHIELQVNCM